MNMKERAGHEEIFKERSLSILSTAIIISLNLSFNSEGVATMDCPFCKEPLAEGLLQSSRAIIWDPKPSAGMVMPYSDNAFYVANGRWKGNLIKSYYCDHCRVILTFREDESK